MNQVRQALLAYASALQVSAQALSNLAHVGSDSDCEKALMEIAPASKPLTEALETIAARLKT